MIVKQRAHTPAYDETQRPPSGALASAWQLPAAAVEHCVGQLGMLQSASNQPLAIFESCSIAKGSVG
jgi:hypothetical protein